MASPFAHRRYARECTLHALYLADSQQISMKSALEQAIEFFSLDEVMAEVMPEGENSPEPMTAEVRIRFEEFVQRFANDIWARINDLDRWISAAIPDYDYSRVAVIDKNVLRLATYELWYLDFIPPAVTINEAIEIAKKYSTAESGKFVNGVLGGLLKQSPKADWDPRTAAPDPDFAPGDSSYVEPARRVETETIDEDSKEFRIGKRYGVWRLRSGDAQIPPSQS